MVNKGVEWFACNKMAKNKQKIFVFLLTITVFILIVSNVKFNEIEIKKNNLKIDAVMGFNKMV